MSQSEKDLLHKNIDLAPERELREKFIKISENFENIERVGKAAYLIDGVWVPFSQSRFDENDDLWVTEWIYDKNF